MFYLSTTKYEKKQYRLKLSLLSTNEKLMTSFLDEINMASKMLSLPIEVVQHKIRKADLEDYVCSDSSDALIILHKNEGRLLLTDSNGLYHSLIKKEMARRGRFG